MNDTKDTTKIAKLNDEIRRSRRWVYTSGVCTLPDVDELDKLIMEYADFNEDNDPYGEHDFGSLTWHSKKVMWKIDYYDQDLRGWCDPMDDKCRRVLTVLLAEEY